MRGSGRARIGLPETREATHLFAIAAAVVTTRGVLAKAGLLPWRTAGRVRGIHGFLTKPATRRACNAKPAPVPLDLRGARSGRVHSLPCK